MTEPRYTVIVEEDGGYWVALSLPSYRKLGFFRELETAKITQRCIETSLSVLTEEWPDKPARLRLV